MMSNPSQYLRRGSYIYRLAQQPKPAGKLMVHIFEMNIGGGYVYIATEDKTDVERDVAEAFEGSDRKYTLKYLGETNLMTIPGKTKEYQRALAHEGMVIWYPPKGEPWLRARMADAETMKKILPPLEDVVEALDLTEEMILEFGKAIYDADIETGDLAEFLSNSVASAAKAISRVYTEQRQLLKEVRGFAQ
jgi:hypothetical protein